MIDAVRQLPDDEAPATLPQITPPPRIGQGHPDHTVIQGLMDLQRSISEVKASVDSLTKTVESTKGKVEKLVEWKNKILGGAMAIGAIIALLSFIFTKFSAYVTIKSPDPAVTQAPAQVPAQVVEQQSNAPSQKSK